SNADFATLASGDRFPRRQAIIAPAPIKSSTQGRSVPSSHLSPDGITAIFGPFAIAASATALQFRKQPAIVVVEPVDRLRLEPFGDGKTRRIPEGRASKDAGD